MKEPKAEHESPGEVDEAPTHAEAAPTPDSSTKSPSRLAVVLSAGAALLALAAVPLGIIESTRIWAVPILAASLGITAVNAAVAVRRPSRIEARTEEDEFRARLGLNAYTILLSASVLALALIGVLAVFAAFGALVVLGDFAVAFVNLYILVVAGPTFLLAFAPPLANRARTVSTEPVSGNRIHIAWAALASGTALGLGALAMSAGLGDLLGIEVLKPERSSFVLSGMAIAYYTAMTLLLRLPSVKGVSDWIEHEPRFQDSNIPRIAVVTASGFSAIALGVSLFSAFGLLPESTAVYALVAAIFTLLIAAFSMGVTHVESRLEFGEDVASARHRRRLILGSLSVSLAILSLVLGIVTALAILAAVADVALFKSLLEVFVANYALVLALSLLPLLAAVIVRAWVPTDVKYTDEAKALVTLLGTGVVILTFYGGFIGSGLAQGVGIGLSNAVLVLSSAVVALALFVKTRALLPGIVSMVRERIEVSSEADHDTKETIRRNMIVTYVVSVLFILGFTGFIIASSLGVVPVEESVTTDITFFAVIVAGIVLLVLLVMRYFQGVNIDPQFAKKKSDEEEIGKKRLTPEELNRYLLLGFSIALATVLAGYGLLLQFDIVNALGPLDLEPQHSTDFFVFALLIGLGPYGWYINKEASRIQAIDQKFPEFLRDLAESERSGMTLTQAVVTAAKGNYGALTWEIRKMAAQIEWGISFTEAIARFAKRVRTPLIERTVSLIVEASNAGGSVKDVLSAAADDSREIQLILKERKSSMSIYVMIIYIAFCVFVGVVAILNAMFIPEVAKAMANADGVTIGGVTFQAFDEQEFRTLFFHGAIIQALGGGLVAGVMEGGRATSGLKHAFIMITIAYLVFRVMLG